jgi:transglutaminase-like putative cysteine protease
LFAEMQFEIRHITQYTYSKPVRLAPQLLRLRPQDTGAQRVLSYSCDIDPPPAGASEFVDLHGNRVHRAWFEGTTRALRIDVRTRVETLRSNPYDYLPSPEGLRLPVAGMSESPEAAPYQARRYGDCPEVAAFVGDVLREAEGETLRFASLLSEKMQSSFTRTVRDSGDPMQPFATLRQRSGACRDLTVLFMDCCRSVGLPSRFASGYQKGDGQRERRFLHAWPEIYVPGGGWRGYDPSHGLAVADEHILLAAAADPRDAAPVEGSFSGVDARSRLDFELMIRTDRWGQTEAGT